MKTYEIKGETCVGMPHCGCFEYAEYEGSVELTDEEVDILVKLIREKNSTDVKDLGLEKSYPELFQKFDKACYAAAYDATEHFWLMEDLEVNCCECASKELMEYLEEKWEYDFEYDEEDYLDDEGNLDEKNLEYDKLSDFQEWLQDYLLGLPYPAAKDFLYNHMNVELNLDDIDYTVTLPSAIIEKAKSLNGENQ